MAAGSAVVPPAIEHAWSRTLVRSLADAGMEAAVSYRIPAAVTYDAIAVLSANAVNRRQAAKDVEAHGQAQQQNQEQRCAGPSPAAVVAAELVETPSMDEKRFQLERLAQLKVQGIVTEWESATQKAAILGGSSGEDTALHGRLADRAAP